MIQTSSAALWPPRVPKRSTQEKLTSPENRKQGCSRHGIKGKDKWSGGDLQHEWTVGLNERA